MGEILGRLRFSGESFVIERNGNPVARLVPYEEEGEKTLRDVLLAWREAGPPDPALADILEDVDRADLPLGDPWP